jgi:hypothetical protein
MANGPGTPRACWGRTPPQPRVTGAATHTAQTRGPGGCAVQAGSHGSSARARTHTHTHTHTQPATASRQAARSRTNRRPVLSRCCSCQVHAGRQLHSCGQVVATQGGGRPGAPHASHSTHKQTAVWPSSPRQRNQPLSRQHAATRCAKPMQPAPDGTHTGGGRPWARSSLRARNGGATSQPAQPQTLTRIAACKQVPSARTR